MPPDPLGLDDLARLPSTPEQPPTDLNLARREADDLVQDKAKRSHRRKQELKDAIHSAVLTFVGVATWVSIGLLVIRALHLILSDKDTWLSEEQLSTLDTLAIAATTGALGSQIGKYISKGMEEED